MGFVFSKIFSGLVGNDQMRIIIIGLDNAGKTTILCKFRGSWIGSEARQKSPGFFVIWAQGKLFDLLLWCVDRLHLNEVEPTVPSKFTASFSHLLFVAVGFNVETVTFNNLKLQVWDLGGQTGLRPYWRCYY